MDNAKQPSTGGSARVNFESKDIRRVDTGKLFTNIKQPSQPGTFRSRVAKFFQSIGAFFGSVFKFFKDHRLARIALIILVVAIPLGVWVLVKAVFPSDIRIGDIVVTRQQINTYASELEFYKELNPAVVLDNSKQTATEFLVENAAFRHFAQTDCAGINVDLSEVAAQHSNRNSFYLRIPAENEAYRQQLAGCLLYTRTIFSVSASFVTPYFNSIEDVAELESAFTIARQKLSYDFMPLFEQGLSIEDIAARADVDRVYEPWSEKPLEFMDVRAFTIASLTACKGDAPHCFNDIDFPINADPGQLFSTTEKIQSLAEIGDYTDVFASRAGAFTIFRLEDQSGLFDSYDAMLEHIHQTYVKKSFFERLFAFVAGKVFNVEDVYAGTNVVSIARAGGKCGPGSAIGTSDGHTVEFYFRAQTTAGLDLSGWEVNISQSGNDCIDPSSYNANLGPGPADGTQPVLLFRTNCMGTGPNFTTSGGRSTLYPEDLVVRHPDGFTAAEYLVWRNSNNESLVPVLAPPSEHRNKPIPWTPVQINEKYEGNGIIIVYEGKTIPTFSAQSAVSVEGGSVYNISSINGNVENSGGANVVAPSTINIVGGVAPQVQVTFEHFINYSGPPPGPIVGPVDPSYCNASPGGPILNPCTPWRSTSFGDVSPMTPVNGNAFTSSVIGGGTQLVGPSGIYQLAVQQSINRTYTLPVPTAGTYQDVRICERLSFDIGLYDPAWLGSSTIAFFPVSGTADSSTACAIFRVNNTGTNVGGPTAPGECPISSHIAEVNRGNTKARSGVINLSKDVGSWAYTSGDATNSGNNVVTDSTRYVWAKPGDSIQFSHTLCFGAQAVRGSTRSSGDGGAGRNERPLAPVAFNTNGNNALTITASSLINTNATPSPDGRYLFGRSLTTSPATTAQVFSRTLTAGAARPLSGIADVSNDYNLTFYSPSSNAGTTFRCFTGGLPDFRTNGYQIPGFAAGSTPAGCGPAVTVPTNSDVGKIIQQKLDWNNVVAWINNQTRDPRGTCGCGETRSVTNISIPSPFTTTPPASIPSAGYDIGYHVYNCRYVRECCCSPCPDGGGCCGYCGEYENQYDYWHYPMTVQANPGPAQTVQVKVPYNYTTSPYVTLPASPVVFGGTDIHVSADVRINPRSNTEIHPTPYATISKPSVFEVVVYTVQGSVANPLNSTRIRHEKSDQAGDKDKYACTYYTTLYNENCQTLARNEYTFNPEGHLTPSGTNDYVSSDNVFNNSITVPDLEAGTKFCVAVGVWPSDSHDDHPTGGSPASPIINPPANPDHPAGKLLYESLSETSSINARLALRNVGKNWHYSEPACRTIAKKPTVQFQSSGVFTDGPITTSQTSKHTDYTISSANIGPILPSGESQLVSSRVNANQRRVFGSWAEYEAIARWNQISGFASGAAFGYNRNNGGNLTNATSTQPPANFFNVPYNVDPELCTYSTQTFNNNHCVSRQVGFSSINSMSDAVLNRLISRYVPPPSAPATAAPDSLLYLALEGYCRLTSGGYQPVNFYGGVPAFGCLSNGAMYVKVEGDAKFGYRSVGSLCASESSADRSGTIVYYVTGKITFLSSITYGSISGGSCSPDSYESIAELPQVIIFAGDADITAYVNKLDSWLVVGKTGTGTGTINTCSGDETKNYEFDDLSTVVTYSTPMCERPLAINGPVFANRLLLHRTAGAGIGTSSIIPAETFNLRPDTYLWAYNQAQRFSQAVTTYSRELAPRF